MGTCAQIFIIISSMLCIISSKWLCTDGDAWVIRTVTHGDTAHPHTRAQRQVAFVVNSWPILKVTITWRFRCSNVHYFPHVGPAATYAYLLIISVVAAKLQLSNVFTARRYASTVYAVVCLSVRLSFCLSVTSRCCAKSAKPRITQTTPYNSPGTVVFWCQKCRRNSNGVTPKQGAK